MNDKNTTPDRPQLPLNFVTLGDSMAADGQALFALGRALRNPRSTLANIHKLAGEAGFSLRITFDRVRPAPEGVNAGPAPGVTVDEISQLQERLRGIGEILSMEWLGAHTDVELVILADYASDRQAALDTISSGGRPEDVVRPSFLPQRSE